MVKMKWTKHQLRWQVDWQDVLSQKAWSLPLRSGL